MWHLSITLLLRHIKYCILLSSPISWKWFSESFCLLDFWSFNLIEINVRKSYFYSRSTSQLPIPLKLISDTKINGQINILFFSYALFYSDGLHKWQAWYLKILNTYRVMDPDFSQLESLLKLESSKRINWQTTWALKSYFLSLNTDSSACHTGNLSGVTLFLQDSVSSLIK